MDGYRFPALGVGDYAVIAVLILVVIVLLRWRRSAKRTARIRKIIRTHLKTLLLKKHRGLSRDDYGNIVDSGWAKEIEYFYHNVIPETLRKSKDLTAVSSRIEKEIGRLPRKTVNAWTMADRHSVATGDDFEHFVKGELEDKGWLVRHTGKSGDQGADLIAEKDGFSVAVQCKLYAKPVGNKAVQEVLAAQRYYATQMAMVVSNAAFTKAATQLAQSANVVLVHTSDLDQIDNLAEDALEWDATQRAR
jgi:restriction system protein